VTEPVLEVRDLCVDYVAAHGAVRAVDHASFRLGRGEVLGIAGESGSGKSTLAQALLRILPPPAVISGGEVRLEGADVLALTEAELRAVRWRRIALVFQSAMDALNPVTTIGEQIVDALHAHGDMGPHAAHERAGALLESVGIPRALLEAFPHQLSGGMRQRVCIAQALALEPSIVILDEPTTALDVIVEREILEQLRALQRRQGFSVLFITHDLGRMLQFSDRVAIFYAARLVEIGPAASIARDPLHPYTRGLLRAFPSLHGDAGVLEGIPGAPPSLQNPPAGCRFHPRCPLVMDRCRVVSPELVAHGPDRRVACHAVTPPAPAEVRAPA